MPTVIDLGQKVKAKYPGVYNDLSDLEVGQKVKAKYPQYADFTDVSDTVATPKKSLGRKIVDFFAEPYVGTAKAVTATKPIFSTNQALQQAQSADQLIQQARQLPLGDPRRTQLLQTANQITQTGQAQTTEQLANIPSTGKAALDIASVAADVLSAGTYGKAAKGLQTARLGKATPTVVKTTEKVGAKITGKRASKKAIEAVSRTADEVSPKEYQRLLRQGLVKPKGIFGKATIKLTETQKAVAEKFKYLLKSKDPVTNINTITKEISKKADDVGKHLASKKIIYNTGELRNRLLNSVDDITDITIPSETALKKAKEGLVDTFIKGLKKNDLVSLWKARISFDDLIELKLRGFSGVPTLKKDLAKALRNEANKFITDKLSEGTYKTAMGEMSELYRLIDLIGNKASKERGLNALGAWAKRNPKIAKALGFGTAAGVSYFGFQRLFGGIGE